VACRHHHHHHHVCALLLLLSQDTSPPLAASHHSATHWPGGACCFTQTEDRGCGCNRPSTRPVPSSLPAPTDRPAAGAARRSTERADLFHSPRRCPRSRWTPSAACVPPSLPLPTAFRRVTLPTNPHHARVMKRQDGSGRARTTGGTCRARGWRSCVLQTTPTSPLNGRSGFELLPPFSSVWCSANRTHS